jgi:dipeptidyl aminopeptidase/acylaminoacyl peptidase
MASSFRLRALTLAFAAASGLASAATPATVAPKMAPAGAEIPIQDFVRHAQFASTKISPTGKYLAVTAMEDGIVSLAVLRVEDLALVKRTVLPDGKSIGAFYWTSPERLLFTAIRNIGRFAAPVGTGEWYAIDADGGHPRTLITYGASDATHSSQTVGYRERYDILDTLRDDDEHVLMTMDRQTGPGASLAEVVMVDTTTGQRRSLARAPRNNCEFAIDAKKEPRYVNCVDTKDASGEFAEHLETYRREPDGNWTLINRSQDSGKRLHVLGAAADGRIYAEQDDRKAPAAFGTVDPATGAFTRLAQDPVAEPEGYLRSADGDSIFGMVTMAGKPKVTLVDGANPDAAIYMKLLEAFPGKFVNFSSATRDGSKILVTVTDDNSPTEIYLYDRATAQARFLLRDRDWLDPERMAKVQAFSFTTRDGHEMYGYLTVPHGVDLKTARNLPMIVNPHGGPIGPRDYWGFNWETQMFASRGYLVLQLNFRGSGGYGQAFQDLGHGAWGGAMQDDLTDVTKWAIQKGYADPERICIYGGSYGGYAALMGAAKEPDLYRCAVGYVGVYDLEMLAKKGDIKETKQGLRFLEHTLGSDAGAKRENSPVHQAAKIKAAVFLAAGLDDDRAPYQHTEAMRDALKAVGHPADEVILQDKEGHGFYKEAHNLNLYSKMLAFFDRYIGSGRGKVSVETVEKPVAPATPASNDSGGQH